MDPLVIWQSSTWRYFWRLTLMIFVGQIAALLTIGWLIFDYEEFSNLVINLPRAIALFAALSVLLAFVAVLSPRHFATVIVRSYRREYPSNGKTPNTPF